MQAYRLFAIFSILVQPGALAQAPGYPAPTAQARPVGRQAEPVTKIVETLQNVFGNVQEEHASDEKTYKSMYEWCNGVFSERKQEHTRLGTAKSELESKLQVQQATNKQLKDEAAQLEQELQAAKDTIAQASSMRQQEHQEYLGEESNFAQLLQVLNRATDVLRSSTSKQTLLQVTQSLQQMASQSSVVSDEQRDQLASFATKAQQTNDSDDVITQSGSVVGIMQQLMQQFQQSAATAVEQEKSALDEYDQLINLKKQAFTQLVTAKDAKDALLAESLQRTAQVQRSAEDAQSAVQGMEEYLRRLQTVCSDKSSQWAARSQSRADILDGLQRALAALAGDSAVISSMQQQQARPVLSFLQLEVPQQQGMMQAQAAMNAAPQQNTYTAVKSMVDRMLTQVQGQTSDEDKHKQWCDNEIGKNSAIQEDKAAKLQRLATKIDNERELVSSLDEDLGAQGQETKSLQTALEQFAKLRMQERDLANKGNANHAMAVQILSQAVAILQRVNSLAQQSTSGGYGFLQQGGISQMQMQSVSTSAVDSLSALQARYTQLKSACDKAETQAQLDMEAFSRASQSYEQIVARTHNYKTSLRLQGMSGLDEDSEDETALKSQLQSVTEYVNRLRTSCAGILQHYDERKQRREQNLQVLSEAKNVINVDNAEEVHAKLQSMASQTDQLAAGLVSTSVAMAPKAAPAYQPPSSLAQVGNSLSMFSQSFGMPMQAQASPPMPLAQAEPAPAQQQASVLELSEPAAAPAQAAPAPAAPVAAPALVQAPAGQSILQDLQSLQNLNLGASDRNDLGMLKA